ncbi:hypothetical protein K450DRAFT_246492 [Umbelopsis ramanniana AG]|uniref:Uncharacterized protein n=1 Tax=Umbelopsis ramanniana AG TaxID=1314678 RepID=A0AAD5E802_UMBRA|nr:uncharacterized protein K450DRAFT_246492 [Umbelopsis ramanniana AG]KAI8578574.1 hypothetical protein K450DRAFT_246492 [Umbelopsis ramanniana AG]
MNHPPPPTSRSQHTHKIFEAYRLCTTATVKLMMIAPTFTVAIYGLNDVFLTPSVLSAILNLLRLPRRKLRLPKSPPPNIRLPPDLQPPLPKRPQMLTLPTRHNLLACCLKPTLHPLLTPLLRLATKVQHLEINPLSTTLMLHHPLKQLLLPLHPVHPPPPALRHLPPMAATMEATMAAKTTWPILMSSQATLPIKNLVLELVSV